MLAWQECRHNMGCVRARVCTRLQKHSWRACSRVPGVCVSEMCCCRVEHPSCMCPADWSWSLCRHLYLGAGSTALAPLAGWRARRWGASRSEWANSLHTTCQEPSLGSWCVAPRQGWVLGDRPQETLEMGLLAVSWADSRGLWQRRQGGSTGN